MGVVRVPRFAVGSWKPNPVIGILVLLLHRVIRAEEVAFGLSTIGERLAHLRSVRSLSLKELASRCSIPYADLLRLEHSGGQTDPASAAKLCRFFHTTEEYLFLGEEPSPASIRALYFRHYAELSEGERTALKFAPIQNRVEAVVEFLEWSFPTALSRAQVAPRLGYTVEALGDLFRGVAPLQSQVLRLLAGLSGLNMDFFIRGDFFGGAVGHDGGLPPELLDQYYQVVQEAIAAGISPSALRQALRILAVREP